MAKIIDLADYRSKKACAQAVRAVQNQDMGEFKKGMAQLLEDAIALRKEAERLYEQRYFGLYGKDISV